MKSENPKANWFDQYSLMRKAKRKNCWKNVRQTNEREIISGYPLVKVQYILFRQELMLTSGRIGKIESWQSSGRCVKSIKTYSIYE